MDDLISRKDLLEAYDKAHKGPPGGARKLIEEAPNVIVQCEDCEYSYTEGFVHPHLVCEKHPEFESIQGDWFCADGWKA